MIYYSIIISIYIYIYIIIINSPFLTEIQQNENEKNIQIIVYK